MITITAKCQTCTWTWKPQKADGPERDYERAAAAARAHSNRRRGHIAQASEAIVTATARGSRIQMLTLEITKS